MKDMKTDNISPEYHYYAFISYNRTDEQWAKWFHCKKRSRLLQQKRRCCYSSDVAKLMFSS